MTKRSISMLVIAWCCAVAVGVCAKMGFELTPAPTETAARHWPAGTDLTRANDSPTLVAFIHPQCPCSRAGLAELPGLAAEHHDKISICVVFVRPAGFKEGWERTDLFDAATRIPGARVIVDDGGKQSKIFGATTSGETLLYAADGRLLFQGGITPSRGHEGNNAGREALAALIDTGHAGTIHTAVYGCALTN